MRARREQKDEGSGRRIPKQGPVSEIHRRLRRDRRHPDPLFAYRLFKMRILAVNHVEKVWYDSQEGTIDEQTVDSLDTPIYLARAV